jgi:hypothetical protein
MRYNVNFKCSAIINLKFYRMSEDELNELWEKVTAFNKRLEKRESELEVLINEYTDKALPLNSVTQQSELLKAFYIELNKLGYLEEDPPKFDYISHKVLEAFNGG